MHIHQWPHQEQPREKLINTGPHSLTDAELLAIFLRVGTRGKSAVDLARQLLLEFGGLHKLMTADVHALTKINGLGIAKYAQLQAGLEVGRRFLQASLHHTDLLTCPEDTKRYLRAKLKHYLHEVFACLFLDSKHHIICFEELFHGSITSASIHPREVIKRCLHHNAAALIIAHNHPSGQCQPSNADRQLTQELHKALRYVDVHLLDHMVIGDDDTASFAEMGLL